jgi:hypothetical protein
MNKRQSDASATKVQPVDRAKVIQLYEQGNTKVDIAKIVGCTEGNVRRILKDSHEFRAQIKQFRENRADLLSDLQERSIQALAKLVDWFVEQDMDSISDAQKPKYIQAITNLMGVMYDKERLETGQSTSNVEQILRVAQGSAGERSQGHLKTISTGQSKSSK